jgi:hypothetical protein
LATATTTATATTRAANYIGEIARAIEEQMESGSLPSRKAYALAEAISKICALYP